MISPSEFTLSTGTPVLSSTLKPLELPSDVVARNVVEVKSDCPFEKIFVEVIEVPLAVMKERAPEKKLVDVALVSVVLERLVKLETYRFVEVTFMPLRLVNETPVEKKLVEVAFTKIEEVVKKLVVVTLFTINPPLK